MSEWANHILWSFAVALLLLSKRETGIGRPHGTFGFRHVSSMTWSLTKRESGGLLPKVQGNQAGGKLARFAAWLRDRLAQKGDLTLDAIVCDLAAVHGVTVHRGSVGKWLHRLGLSHKKTLLASEILRPDVAERRRAWVEIFQPDMARACCVQSNSPCNPNAFPSANAASGCKVNA